MSGSRPFKILLLLIFVSSKGSNPFVSILLKNCETVFFFLAVGAERNIISIGREKLYGVEEKR